MWWENARSPSFFLLSHRVECGSSRAVSCFQRDDTGGRCTVIIRPPRHLMENLPVSSSCLEFSSSIIFSPSPSPFRFPVFFQPTWVVTQSKMRNWERNSAAAATDRRVGGCVCVFVWVWVWLGAHLCHHLHTPLLPTIVLQATLRPHTIFIKVHISVKMSRLTHFQHHR